MKVLNFIAHPLTLILSFGFIIISGENMAGFYIMYLIMGLLQKVYIHCILGIAGIIMLFPALFTARKKHVNSIYLLNITGAICMMLSLFLFFFNDEQRYNVSTFYQFIPFCTIVIFCLFSLIFVVANIKALFKPGLIKK